MNTRSWFFRAVPFNRKGLVLLLPVQALLLGCGEGGPDGTFGTRRDSAGIEIVEVHPSTWPPSEVWQVVESPDVSIGILDGDPEYELYEVEGVVGLHGGDLVVAEGDATLRFYNQAGLHLETLERQGEGPGEAVMFSGMSKYRGDSLLLSTIRGQGRRNLNSLLVLNEGAQFGRNVEAWFPGRSENTDTTIWLSRTTDAAQASLADGSFVVEGAMEFLLSEAEGGVVPGRAALMRLDPEGTLLDTIDMVTITVIDHQPLNPMKFELMLLEAEAPPARSHEMDVYWTPGDRYMVNIYEAEPAGFNPGNPSTTLRRSFRILTPSSLLTAAHRAEYINIVVEAYYGEDPPSEQREDREHLKSLRSPDSLPALQDLRIDALGNIWLELFEIPGKDVREYAQWKGLSVPSEPPLWVVLGPEGDLLGSVRAPVGLEIKEIGSDYLLGIAADEYGVQQVRKYSIRKGRTGIF